LADFFHAAKLFIGSSNPGNKEPNTFYYLHPLTYLFYLVLISNALFFLFYGLQCFTSPFMFEEFRRFGLPDSQRILTGVLQLMGAAGLFAGLIFPLLGLLSSVGLSLMMLIAFGVRIRIKDGLAQSAPSLAFMFINGYLALGFMSLL
jgi:hypothetical protein